MCTARLPNTSPHFWVWNGDQWNISYWRLWLGGVRFVSRMEEISFGLPVQSAQRKQIIPRTPPMFVWVQTFWNPLKYVLIASEMHSMSSMSKITAEVMSDPQKLFKHFTVSYNTSWNATFLVPRHSKFIIKDATFLQSSCRASLKVKTPHVS
jgi:hypothetical protein